MGPVFVLERGGSGGGRIAGLNHAGRMGGGTRGGLHVRCLRPCAPAVRVDFETKWDLEAAKRQKCRVNGDCVYLMDNGPKVLLAARTLTCTTPHHWWHLRSRLGLIPLGCRLLWTVARSTSAVLFAVLGERVLRYRAGGRDHPRESLARRTSVSWESGGGRQGPDRH